MKKKYLVVMVLICIFTLLSGCRYKGYSGKNRDLYTVAINSLLWNLGHSYGADRVKDSQIEILEEDSYGKKMFIYYERYYAGAKLSFSALIISQHSLDGFVYYFEDSNFLLKKQELFTAQIQEFTTEEKNNLKILNDWNKEINLSKCIKKEVTKYKKNIPMEKNIILEELTKEFNLQNQQFNLFTHFLTINSKLNYIFYGSIRLSEENNIFFAALVQPKEEGYTIQFFVPSDVYNYQEEFLVFKIKNRWSTA